MHESFCRRARFCNPGYLIVAMKRIGRILLYFALSALAVSCANYRYDGPEAFNDKMEGLFIHYDSQAPYATAIVTVKKGSDGNSYLWLSEEHKLIPRKQIPFTGQYRAMAGISESGIPDNNGFRSVTVDWLEPLDEGEVRAGADGGADEGLDILLDSWITGLEDAYLTIHYNTWWGEHPVHHDFYLEHSSGTAASPCRTSTGRCCRRSGITSTSNTGGRASRRRRPGPCGTGRS